MLINAAQAMPEGHASGNRIVIRAHCETAEYVVVEVEDTGAGIAPEHLALMFTPFFTTNPRGMGTGLGLSICKRIVTSFGGDITVESQLGRGTRFRVLLKALHARPIAVVTPVTRARPSRRGHILVVDDDRLTARAVWRTLMPEHEVSILLEANEALARIETGERFDVIICDLMMPNTSGPEFYAEVYDRAPEYAERIIFLTGGAFTMLARDFLDRVPNPCIAKPFESQALRALVNDRVMKAYKA